MIDSHAHLSKTDLMPHVDALLVRAQSAGIKGIVNICTDEPSLRNGLILAERYPWIFNTASTTPHDAHLNQDDFFDEISVLARNGKLVAIGETGLEYHYFPETASEQKRWLISYMKLALETRLPLVIHCREAFKDLFEIIDSEYAEAPGILHCFTGNLEDAQGVIQRGWYLSLSGIVTYKKSVDLQQVAKWVPLDRMLIETDSPFLAPQSHRGKQNEPAFIVETAACIAALKGVTVEDVISMTSANAIKAFNLSL